MNPARGAVAGARRRAVEDAGRYRQDPAALARLPLGRFSDAGPRMLLLRRLALRFDSIARLIEWSAAMLPARVSAKAVEPAADIAYWRSARAALPAATWASLSRGPVILMYHAVGEGREAASRYVIPRRRLEQHVRWLRRRGYCLVTLAELVRLRRADSLPPKTVALTFDDGYRDNAPALLGLRAPATVFIPTGYTGRANEWDADGRLRGRALLGWDELRVLSEAGVEIGGHSRSHPRLPELPSERQADEVCGSLSDLRRELGGGAYTFAYPHGRFSAETQAAVADACVGGDTRFVAAACSRGGVNDPSVDAFELRRVEIKGTDSFLSFMLMVELGRRITPGQWVRSLLFGG